MGQDGRQALSTTESKKSMYLKPTQNLGPSLIRVPKPKAKTQAQIRQVFGWAQADLVQKHSIWINQYLKLKYEWLMIGVFMAWIG